MKRQLSVIILLASIICISSCNFNGGSGNDGSITGTWQEYRDDGDDYLLSTFVFNSDGTGVFKVDAMTNTQRFNFRWYLSGQEIYLDYGDGNTSTLSYSQGLIFENSAFGEKVFKKK